VVLSIKACLS